MSILERIRKRSGLLVGSIFVALLLFVLSDMLSTRYSLFGRQSNDVGEIKGETISYKAFEAKVKESEENYKINAQTDKIDASTSEMIRDQTWNGLIQEMLMNEEYDKLGITVTAAEVLDMVQGKDPHQAIKTAPIFQNQQTKEFDRSLVIRYLKEWSEDPEGDQMKRWIAFEQSLQKERLNQKFNGLVKGGLYANSLEAREVYLSRNKTVDIKFAGLSYASIADTTVQISDDDLKKYFDKNITKYKYKENSRKLEFVVFDQLAAAEDTQSALRWINDQMAPFSKSVNDSIYVLQNSDAPFDSLYKNRGQLSPAVEEALFSGEVGTMAGPILDNGSYKIFKLSKISSDTNYQMRASHILFKVENNDTAAAIKKANEVLAQIRKGASFEQMAMIHGTDGTKDRGGDLGWFNDGAMVPKFNDAVKRGSKGDMFVVTTQFGPHIVKVTENKSAKKIQVAVLERKIQPSNKTVQKIYAQANQFAANSRDAAAFDKNSSDAKLAKRVADMVKENDHNVQGLENSREIIRWAFNEETKKGDVSEVFDVNNKFVVAILKEIREKDKSNFEDVRLAVTEDTKKEKKAEQIIEKLNKALAESKDPVAIAIKLGSVANDANGQSFENPNIPYIGMDRTILGTIFGMKENTISEPLKGDNGAYVVKVVKVNNPAIPKDLKQFRDELMPNLKSRGEYEPFNALKEISNVVDNRFRFY